MNLNLRTSCIMVGEQSLLIQCAEHWIKMGHQLVAVVSASQSVQDWARQTGIPAVLPRKAWVSEVKLLEFDYFFSVTNLRIIPAELLEQSKIGAFNFHDGPLPEYAGLYTPAWALMNQEPQHGVTWHHMEAGIDTGPIAAQKRFALAPDETSVSLNVKCFEAGIETFVELTEQITAGQVERRPQNLSQRVYYSKNQRPVAAAVLDWSQPAEKLDALIRALDFGSYDNPLTRPKIYLSDSVIFVQKGKLSGMASTAQAGTIVAADETAVVVSTATTNISLSHFTASDGRTLTPADLLAAHNLSVGDKLPQLTPDQQAEITRTHQQSVGSEFFWKKQLSTLTDISIPLANQLHGEDETPEYGACTLDVAETIDPDRLSAILAAYLLRLTNQTSGTVLFKPQNKAAAWPTLFETHLPLTVTVKATVGETLAAIEKQVKRGCDAAAYAKDLVWRAPELADLAAQKGVLPLSVSLCQGAVAQDPQTPLAIYHLNGAGSQMGWLFDTKVHSADMVNQMRYQFKIFLEFVNDPAHQDVPFSDSPLLDEQAKEQMLYGWNDTWQPFPAEACVHEQFMAQAAVRPDAPAVIYHGVPLSYRELDERSNQLAHYLMSLGIVPDAPVGIFMDRTADILVALLGVLKAGGCYLPLDPKYPTDRLAFMVEDTQTPVLLTQNRLLNELPQHEAKVVQIDADWEAEIGHLSKAAPVSAVNSSHLSYIIYTSGSTGKPKGVMIEHRNVINFFVGMDGRIPHKAGDRWLAVTSLSFDISVLELFWTLSRGLTIVLHNGDQEGEPDQSETRQTPSQAIDFSLYYFASDEGEKGVTNKYELLLEGAKFADKHGFAAVWTPERHFHAFGGLYPNPSVISGALATMTENVQIRAGSVVLPLHHPARVAEEWAVVDNLSNGRVGISFAAGWQPNDFVFQPENFDQRKQIMFEQIEQVRSLWRGEKITYTGGNGPIDIQTLPRPVQDELPTWVTAAGNPDTFRQAGANGYFLLTHLLGQSVDELGQKIAIYRQAWRDNGHHHKQHGKDGHVTILLHTLIGEDLATVKELVRKPMTDYLRSSVFLIRQAAWSFPTFKQKADESGQTPQEVFDNQELTEGEMDALLDHAFERYFAHSGLLGDLDKGLKMVGALKQIGIDEIACQIDFGVSTADTLAHLPYLNRLRQQSSLAANPPQSTPYNGTEAMGDFSIPALIERHKVTHFQCTPSMMGMLLVDERQQAAMQRLQVCMLGGEALPQSLAADVLTHLPSSSQLINMYGPTETTIWSSTQAVTRTDRPIPVGRPIANTALYIVDDQLNPVPAGQPGELLIGGDGVVRGYLNRPKLTADRFVSDPFRRERGHPHARMYRTGDLARFRPDGTVDFLGRIDFQVKLRGYRIELGEIEALLAKHQTVRDAVVTVREDVPGDKRMVAYLIPKRDQAIDPAALRQMLKETLPAFMVPAHFVTLSEFPLTPNRKTDRKALPPPQAQLAQTADDLAQFEPPQTDHQKQIADIWQTALGVGRIGIHDNFFEMGGHSILAVQVHRQIRTQLQIELSIADLFRYATIASISDFLANQGAPVLAAHELAVARAAKRRKALGLNGNHRKI